MSQVVLCYNDESSVIYIEPIEATIEEVEAQAVADGYTVVGTADDSTLPNRYLYFFEAWEYNGDYSEVVVNLAKAKVVALREAVQTYLTTKPLFENRALLGLTNPFTVEQLETSKTTLVSDINSATTVEELLQTLDGFMQDYNINYTEPMRAETIVGQTIIDPNYPL